MINSEKGIEWLIAILRKDQSPVGSWNYPFETGISTDAYMIILLRTLAINDEQLIKGLASRIISKQEKNGAWKLFYDEGGGNISASVEAYSLGISKSDPLIKKAIDGMLAMKTDINSYPHMQYTAAAVWNTNHVKQILRSRSPSIF